MTVLASTGLRDDLLDTNSLKSLLDGGVIRIYDGTPPAAADDALGTITTNNLLVEISLNGGGTGINFDTAASGGALAKAPGETWQGTIGTTGTASFFRHVLIADDGTLSTTARRLQGSIGVAANDMNLDSVSLTATEVLTISDYQVTLPIS